MLILLYKVCRMVHLIVNFILNLEMALDIHLVQV